MVHTEINLEKILRIAKLERLEPLLHRLAKDILSFGIEHKNWKEILKEKKIDPSLNWSFAEIISVKESEIIFQILNKKEIGRAHV